MASRSSRTTLVQPERLADAVRVVAAGDSLLAPVITQRLIAEYVRRPPPGSALPAELSELTERELVVLKLIARGLSNGEIATEPFRLPDRLRAAPLAPTSGSVAGPGSARG